MADPFGVLDALYGLAGPFLFAVALFVLGLVGYAVLLALGRVGVLDDGTVDGRSDGAPEVDGADVGETTADGSDDGEAADARSDGDGLDTDGPDDRPRRV